MTVPSEPPLHVVPSLVGPACHHILDGPRQNVSIMRQARCKRGSIIKCVPTMTPDPHIHMYIFVINGGSTENAYINNPAYILNMDNNPIYIYVINGSPLYNLYLQLSIILHMNVINLIHHEHMYGINYIFMYIYITQYTMWPLGYTIMIMTGQWKTSAHHRMCSYNIQLYVHECNKPLLIIEC